ncbi:hypothetical protein LTR91_020037 [Friedmanniomyces endolithicus]|uniref:HAM1-like N-terminal domain-containing protein n=2 Tax=Dothideomycetidae TaxID=451867 RepID=A0AAN6HAR8_9PEZI|nr:hypothetical protein LTR75_008891 [Friedmanniomyces endolithicus]KAK5140636.1 hypothetical protein LTR32_006617 [Rachicladosporium monterosium]KAK0846641.1 hypothetical protein LTR03_006722 [Friedmanniomyces endolithicus]KAK0860987.1 hypothetical protein LTS02_008098 [Friedmanniomyces endolithicus]KAK0895096.1 hypothetical protein LTR02_011932 [Friedmanniomyces endolithicus]
MDAVKSCLGMRQSQTGEREPLLPQYEQDTDMQRQLHQKLHSYQMFRAMSKGYMPSTEQAIVNLRTILASDVLNANNPELSDSGRKLIKYTRQWLQEFMDMLEHKNGQDQIQDLVWFLSKSKISVDVEDLAHRAKKSKARADTAAAYASIKTVGSLLLTNSDFRVFLDDLSVVGKEVFSDSAFALSKVAEKAGKQLEPSEEKKQQVAQPGADDNAGAPSAQDLGSNVADMGGVVVNGTAEVAKTAMHSAQDKLSGDEGQTMLNRLKEAVMKLRKRNDYSDSVSTLGTLIQRYAIVYSRAAEEVTNIASEDIQQNAETDRAMKHAWILVTSFGDKNEWDKVEELFHKVMSHRKSNPQFEEMMRDVGSSLQKLLTDPNFFDHAQEKFQELREKSEKSGIAREVSQDIQALLQQIEITLRTVLQDTDIHKLITTTTRLATVLSPPSMASNPELLQDAINVFVPLLIAAIQYIPIPRLEVSTPDVDLLLENLIIEPGKTVNNTSFLPYRLKVETYNDFELRKAKFRTTSSATSLMTIKIDGLSARADEIGFWLRAHSGIFRLADEGIASFALDEKGIDIHIDVEIGKEKMEQILTLKAVRVHVHKLNYQLRKTKFSWIGFLLKPLLRPIMRKVMEKQLATALADFFHTANRELLYARERLRATRISNPDDMMTFFKAVAARLQPEEDPDVYTRVGVDAPSSGRVKKNVFTGVYAPGSVVKVWHEEAERAAEHVDDFSQDGWRNEIFTTHTQMMT